MTELIKVDPIDPKKIDLELEQALKEEELSRALVVNDQASLERAAAFLSEIKARAKDLESERKKITIPLDNAKKAVQALFSRPKEVLESIEGIIKGKMIEYAEGQERKRQEEQARLDRIAAQERKKKEDQERAWREKEEAARKEAARLEAEGKAEEARKAQEVADKAAAKAEERSQAADDVFAPIAAPKVEKVAGVSYRENWTAEVVDFSLLPDVYKLPDMVKLNKQAKATKNSVPIPGVVFKMEKILASK
jgi:hypothetical protein